MFFFGMVFCHVESHSSPRCCSDPFVEVTHIGPEGFTFEVSSASLTELNGFTDFDHWGYGRPLGVQKTERSFFCVPTIPHHMG